MKMKATTRLALTYLAIIMSMSLGFSVVTYRTSDQQLARQVPTPSYEGTFGFTSFQPDYDLFFKNRISEARRALIVRLVLFNLLTLVGGSVVSYLLARRTLKPIEESMEAQSQFISDASHELRTPLTAIQTSNEVALRKPKLKLEDAKLLIEQNTQDVIKLKELSEGLLRLANKDTRQRKLGAVSLQEAATEAINQFIAAAQAKEITINDEVPSAKVSGDKQSLGQVIAILLDNAIKYSEPKSVITLHGSVKGKFAYLHVRDEGMGIKPADLPHLFKRFYRADRSRSKDKRDGYGLGLSIADKLIRQQKGEITVTSKPGKGSVFTVKLSLARKS